MGRWLKGSPLGNVVVWLSLLIGQPVAILLDVQSYEELRGE